MLTGVGKRWDESHSLLKRFYQQGVQVLVTRPSYEGECSFSTQHCDNYVLFRGTLSVAVCVTLVMIREATSGMMLVSRSNEKH